MTVTAEISNPKVDLTGVSAHVESVKAVRHSWYHAIQVVLAGNVLGADKPTSAPNGLVLTMSEPDIRLMCERVLETLDDPDLRRPKISYRW